MKTITDSLKNFYAKLGGNPSNLPSRSTSADIIDAMSDVYTDKEGTHVEVTTQVTEGTKIATIKTNNEDHDIYAPKEVKYINCTWSTDVANRVMLPSGVTTADIYNDLSNGILVVLSIHRIGSSTTYLHYYPAMLSNNSFYYKVLDSDASNDYYGSIYCTQASSDINYLIYGTHNLISSKNLLKLSATLSMGATSVSFTNDNIHSSSCVEVYTDVFGVDPTDITFTSPNTITVTFEAQNTNITVGLVVMNL